MTKLRRPWETPAVEIPPWNARLGGPIWMLNQPGNEGGAGDGGGQGAPSGDGTTGQGAGTASGGTGNDDQGDGQGAGQSSSDDASRAELERLKEQRSLADKRAAAAEAKLKEIEDSKKDELTKATERAQELEKSVSQLQQEVTQLRLEKAMLSDPEFGADKWQDPEEVLDKLNRAVRDEQVTVKDGEVDGASVKAFLKDLAAKKKYLLKEAGAGTGSPKGASGAPVGGGDRRGADSAAKDDELRKRYRIR